MNSRIATVLSGGVLLWPTWAFASGREAVEGSWFPLIFYALNFLLFLWVVRRYGWSAVTGFFSRRAHTIRENRNRAEQAFRETQALAARAAEQLKRLEDEKRKITAELAQETDYQLDQINQAAREAVSRIRRDAELTSAALRDGAQRHLREAMAAAAGRIARQLVSRNFEPSDQTRLLHGFVQRMAEEADR
jgi:F-type H+-transporting ATPase subunit b